MKLFRTSAVLFFIIASTNYSGANEELKQLGQNLRTCYNKQAFSYGLSVCHAPSELLPVMKSKCRSQINSVRDHIKRVDTWATADEVTREFVEELEQDSMATIIEFQSSNRSCRNAKID